MRVELLDREILSLAQEPDALRVRGHGQSSLAAP
jgi:hypothetical protein